MHILSQHDLNERKQPVTVVTPSHALFKAINGQSGQKSQALTDLVQALGSNQIILVERPSVVLAAPLLYIRDQTGRIIAHVDRAQEPETKEEGFFDPLTGLPNRTLFENRLNTLFTSSKRSSDEEFAVLFLDLDRFKIVNDTLGHEVGDQLLIQVAERLKRAIRGNDTVARLGGDEFTILAGIKHPSDAISLAQRIDKALTETFEINDLKINIGTSIGIAFSDTRYESAQRMIEDADRAMYEVKASRKAQLSHGGTQGECYRIADDHIMSIVSKQIALKQALIEMIRIDGYAQLIQSAQAIYNKNDNLIGYEIFTHWEPPAIGHVTPNELISTASKTGSMSKIGKRILIAAASFCKQQISENNNIIISINLSEAEFLQKDLAEQIRQVIASTGINGGNLRFEIDIRTIMKHKGASKEVLTTLQEIGVSISFDNVGIDGILTLPIDLLTEHKGINFKIDPTATKNAETDQTKLTTLETLIKILKVLDATVTLVGIENPEQANAIATLSHDYIQGRHVQQARRINQ